MLNHISEKPGLTPVFSDLLMQPDQVTLRILDRHDSHRDMAETFVKDIFFKSYQAHITTFYPVLLSITRMNNRFAAVAGVRPAASEALFSEHYLDRPIEQILSTPREKIVEIGNLAPDGAGHARWLISTLNSFMVNAGFSHVVFTAVPRLRNAFKRLNLPLTCLADASQEHLPDYEKMNWGHYYDAKPAVYVGDLMAGESFLSSTISTNPFQLALSKQAALAGQQFAHAMRLSSELVTS